MITREYLKARIQELSAARDKLQGDVYANNGAIQFCQHLLATLELEAKAEPEAMLDPEAEAVEEGSQRKPNGEVDPAVGHEGEEAGP
jgi:hypothetical protein